MAYEIHIQLEAAGDMAQISYGTRTACVGNRGLAEGMTRLLLVVTTPVMTSTLNWQMIRISQHEQVLTLSQLFNAERSTKWALVFCLL